MEMFWFFYAVQVLDFMAVFCLVGAILFLGLTAIHIFAWLNDECFPFLSAGKCGVITALGFIFAATIPHKDTLYLSAGAFLATNPSVLEETGAEWVDVLKNLECQWDGDCTIKKGE